VSGQTRWTHNDHLDTPQSGQRGQAPRGSLYLPHLANLLVSTLDLTTTSATEVKQEQACKLLPETHGVYYARN